MNATPTGQGWQPIETVARLQTPVLVTDGRRIWITHHPRRTRAQGQATHWMVLPDPPQAHAGDGEPDPR